MSERMKAYIIAGLFTEEVEDADTGDVLTDDFYAYEPNLDED
jgi:hypothetical protein